MAADKTNNLSVFLTDIADQIRANDGTTASINPQDFRTRISNTVGANVAKPTELAATSDTNTATALSYGTKYKLSAGYYASAKYYSVPADRYQTGYDAGNTAGQATGKTNYEPKSATITNAGALTVKNAAGTSIYTATLTPNYNGGYSAAQTEFEPKSATLSNAGVLSVKNNGGTQKYTTTFANSYDAGAASVTITTLGYTSETSLSGSLSGTTYTVSTPQTKGCHTTKLTKDVTPATLGLTAKAAETITPGTSDKTIAQNVYTTGIQTIKGDSNLLAANIKSGVTIFNVQGTYSGSSVSLTGDATEENVRNGKTFYSNSTTKKTGSMPDSNIATSEYIIIDDSWDYGIDISRGYTSYHSIKGFNVPQDATMYVNDMGQNSSLYVYGGDGDLYIGDGDDDYEDYVRVIRLGDIVWSNFGINQYAGGTKKDTIIPGTSNVYVFVTSGVKSSDEYIQINGDSNLKSANIKEGVSIFGVRGSLATGIGTKVEGVTFSKGTYNYLTCAVKSNTTNVPCQVSFSSGYNSTSYYNRTSTITKTSQSSDPTYATTPVGRFAQTSAANVTTYPRCVMIFTNVLAGDKIFFKSMSGTSSSSASYGTEAYITVGTGIAAQTNLRNGYLTVMVVITFTSYTTCVLTEYIL